MNSVHSLLFINKDLQNTLYLSKYHDVSYNLGKQIDMIPVLIYITEYTIYLPIHPVQNIPPLSYGVPHRKDLPRSATN